MRPFSCVNAVALPLVRDDIDTDIIIPSREMKTVGKTGLKDGLFAGWRYSQIGGREPNPKFVLNRPGYAGASVLLGGDNFGCGSSREHAVWALVEYGFRAVIAPGFNPIFYGNCVRNGLVPVVLPRDAVDALAAEVQDDPVRHRVSVDLEHCVVLSPSGTEYPFDLAEDHRQALLHGLDPIELTLRHAQDIDAFVARDRVARPWVYLESRIG